MYPSYGNLTAMTTWTTLVSDIAEQNATFGAQQILADGRAGARDDIVEGPDYA
jgi:hypothetical protein